jgi:hypothetical protein
MKNIGLNESLLEECTTFVSDCEEEEFLEFMDRLKAIVLLELMAIIYSDDYLHEEERVVLEKILEEFDLNYNLSIVYTEWDKTMLSLYKQGNALINI